MGDYITKSCAICGKEIVVNNADNWAYKINPGKGGTIFFCRYSHKRQYEKEHAEKKVDLIAQAAEEETKKPKKMPTERGCIARSLQDVIRAGKNPIDFLRAQGYKNPYEAYNSVRHYCETNEPHLAEVLKPLRELPFERTKPTGRPRKSEVETVDKVPEVEPVQCVAHVTAAEIQEAQNAEKQVPPERLEVRSIETGETDMKQFLHLYSREDILLIVDKAALDCQKDHRIITMSSSGVKDAMFQNATVAAENVGIMKLRKQIRKMLGADEEEWTSGSAQW